MLANFSKFDCGLYYPKLDKIFNVYRAVRVQDFHFFPYLATEDLISKFLKNIAYYPARVETGKNVLLLQIMQNIPFKLKLDQIK